MGTTPDWDRVVAVLSATTGWTEPLPGLLDENVEVAARALMKRLRGSGRAAGEVAIIAEAITALGYGDLALELAAERGLSCR